MTTCADWMSCGDWSVASVLSCVERTVDLFCKVRARSLLPEHSPVPLPVAG